MGRWHELYSWWWWSALRASENHDVPTFKKSAPRSIQNHTAHNLIVSNCCCHNRFKPSTFKIIWPRARILLLTGQFWPTGRLLPTTVLELSTNLKEETEHNLKLIWKYQTVFHLITYLKRLYASRNFIVTICLFFSQTINNQILEEYRKIKKVSWLSLPLFSFVT